MLKSSHSTNEARVYSCLGCNDCNKQSRGLRACCACRGGSMPGWLAVWSMPLSFAEFFLSSLEQFEPTGRSFQDRLSAALLKPSPAPSSDELLCIRNSHVPRGDTSWWSNCCCASRSALRCGAAAAARCRHPSSTVEGNPRSLAGADSTDTAGAPHGASRHPGLPAVSHPRPGVPRHNPVDCPGGAGAGPRPV